MAAHRYWALLVTARAGSGNGVGIAEVEMRASTGGADQCTGGTASGASSFGLVAGNAFDDNDATIWHNAATGGNAVRLSYDFNSPTTVVEIFVRNPPAGATTGLPGVTYGPAACWVQWSDDGATWYYGGPAADLSGLGNAGTATIAAVTDASPPAIVRGDNITLAPGWPAQALNAQVRSTLARTDIEDGGAYRIAGITRKESSPDVFVVYPYRRVRLLERQTGRLIRETWSDPVTGAYAFEKLKLREYILLTDDHARYYNAVAADAIVPVL